MLGSRNVGNNSGEDEVGNDVMFKCDCDSVCDDRLNVAGQWLLYKKKKERQVYMRETGGSERCDREVLESFWDCEKKATAVSGKM